VSVLRSLRFLENGKGFFLIILFLISSTFYVYGDPLTVTTSKKVYDVNEKVYIYVNGRPNTVYVIDIVNPYGNHVYPKEFKTDSNGKATVTWGGSDIEGTYTVYVALGSGGESASTTFKIKKSAPPPPPASTI